MTIIHDDSGTRWVELPQRKRRKSARALRFGEIKVGDQLMRRWPDMTKDGGSIVWYYRVADLWTLREDSEASQVAPADQPERKVSAAGSACVYCV